MIKTDWTGSPSAKTFYFCENFSFLKPMKKLRTVLRENPMKAGMFLRKETIFYSMISAILATDSS